MSIFRLAKTKKGFILFASISIFCVGFFLSFFIEGECACDNSYQDPEGECSLIKNTCKCMTNKIDRATIYKSEEEGKCDRVFSIVVICLSSALLILGSAIFVLGNDSTKDNTPK